MLKKVLIANRGEIAVRIEQTLKAMGIGSVAVFSDADRTALHVRNAGEAYPLQGTVPADTYLNLGRLLAIARESGCDALHPGYGFLSESPRLSEACREAGLVFIGPSPEAMRLVGNKAAAKQLATSVNVPTVPGALLEAVRSGNQIGTRIVK